ncbi:MAG: hypothetical protein IKT80_05075 [Bacteroidaceae bacterium]|nr:hypothetical protein [Bacteroidaceae bacterium]
MKIITNKTYDDYITTLMRLSARVDKLTKENKRLKEENYRLNKTSYISSHAKPIIFPNTDERGLGDSDTPTNLSDRYYY